MYPAKIIADGKVVYDCFPDWDAVMSRQRVYPTVLKYALNMPVERLQPQENNSHHNQPFDNSSTKNVSRDETNTIKPDNVWSVTASQGVPSVNSKRAEQSNFRGRPRSRPASPPQRGRHIARAHAPPLANPNALRAHPESRDTNDSFCRPWNNLAPNGPNQAPNSQQWPNIDEHA